MDKLSVSEVMEFMKWKNAEKTKKLDVIEAIPDKIKVKKEKRKCSEKQLAALAAGRQKQIEKMLSLAKSKQ
jgi:predicted Fe-S protein YdhL (DUF1289 family)